MLTRGELLTRLEAAKSAERSARVRAAQLRRELSAAGRRQDTQYKCCLGGVLVALAERGTPNDLHVVLTVRNYLSENPPHHSNAAVVQGTPFDPDAPCG